MSSQDTLIGLTEFSHMVIQVYVGDLEDRELLVRSVPGTNHIAWQLGHLIAATDQMLQALGQPGFGLSPEFYAAHSPETANSDDASQFMTKAEYLTLIERAKAATLAAIRTVPESTHNDPGPEFMREHVPTVGAMLALLSTHWLMHAGQFVPIRRKLGKAPLF